MASSSSITDSLDVTFSVSSPTNGPEFYLPEGFIPNSETVIINASVFSPGVDCDYLANVDTKKITLNSAWRLIPSDTVRITYVPWSDDVIFTSYTHFVTSLLERAFPLSTIELEGLLVVTWNGFVLAPWVDYDIIGSDVVLKSHVTVKQDDVIKVSSRFLKE
jgi:hypothetical protein